MEQIESVLLVIFDKLEDLLEVMTAQEPLGTFNIIWAVCPRQ
jgi:hypothetical protein